MARTSQGFTQVTSDFSVTPHTLSPPGGATIALIRPIKRDVRWRDDGVAPTQAVGKLLRVDEEWECDTSPLTDVKIIALHPDAELEIAWYS